MNEKRLQFDCVTWFNNSVPTERGTLFAILNETNKGAHKKGIGLVKGASDLAYIAQDGVFCPIELKVPDTRHEVEHLKRQIDFIKKMNDRGGLGFFCFSKNHFQHIIASLTPGVTISAQAISDHSIRFIENSIVKGEMRKTKTVKLEWDENMFNSIL